MEYGDDLWANSQTDIQSLAALRGKPAKSGHEKDEKLRCRFKNEEMGDAIF